MTLFSNEMQNGLVWLPELGIGRFPVPPERPYDSSYFAKYRQMAQTSMGIQLNAARIQLVARHHQGKVLDVGIGSGQFVETRTDTWGYDVNPEGVAWLKAGGRWANLYEPHSPDGDFPALTFWDSLEHIDDPEAAVARAGQWVFVSLPVFKNAEHILTSRHYRKDEHIWYFTDEGIRRWFGVQGFVCAEHNTIESMLGRDGISSYAFRRVNHAAENA
ncbi:methyltransferase domain-containing protein [Enterobacter asburiae]|uniref:class I SAM-dependent methyltransferase n=1 Tax=Enterobacter asburiae TaxID=61645 RepID=UPI002B24849B|nr:methyltransferase domain-containing protein [Enterobacter asburiae]MEB2409396.1 methyltransferase domain-containing protein [Enterobacter asburiae]HAS0916750.1 class I SAM-dependent methyltransferase [Enterobacter asburiae]